MVEALKDFVPVLVDGDEEKTVTAKLGVNGFPDTKFMDAGGKALGEVGGFVEPAEFLREAKAARAKIKALALTPAYAKLVKARQDLDKSLEKKDWAKALPAVEVIEKARHEGPESKIAAKAREEISKAAQEALQAAESLTSEGKTPEALSAFDRIATSFKGLPEAEAARKRITELKARK